MEMYPAVGDSISFLISLLIRRNHVRNSIASVQGIMANFAGTNKKKMIYSAGLSGRE